MEQDIGIIASLLGWAAEEIITLVIGSAIGAVGAKWFFGRKNSAELKQLRHEVERLKGNHNEQASSSPSTSAPMLSVGSVTIRSLVPGLNPPDALLTPKELLALVKGHTSITANTLLKPHKGRRHYVRGIVEDVRDQVDRVHVGLKGVDEVSFALWFKKRWQKDILEKLRQGDEISATGILRHVSNHIGLDKCTVDSVNRDGTHQDN